MERLNLQIPEDMVKLLSDVIRVLLDKSGVNRRIAEKLTGYLEKGNRKEYEGMFEAVIESIIEEREEARAVGRKEGLEQGLFQGREEIARNLLAKGSTPEFIQEVTGLDLATIQELGKQQCQTAIVDN